MTEEYGKTLSVIPTATLEEFMSSGEKFMLNGETVVSSAMDFMEDYKNTQIEKNIAEFHLETLKLYLMEQCGYSEIDVLQILHDGMKFRS